MKNLTLHKIAQTIVLFAAIVWACMLFTSCSSTAGAYRYGSKDFKGCKQNYKSLNCPM